MKKIFKIFTTLLILCSLAAITFIYWRYTTTPTKITPYPYTVKKAQFSGVEEVKDSDVLIIGDRMGKALDPYINSISNLTSKELAEPLKIRNWSRPHEGLHRTLAKIKSLKTLPQVIIYHGASEELFEKKFNLKDYKKIKKNFKLYENEKVLTTIMTYPPLSKFIYNQVKDTKLNVLTKNTDELSPSKRQKQFEIEYILYKQELKDLIEYIKDAESNLILITTPLNLEIQPKEVCSNSITTTIQIEQTDIQKLLKSNSTKEAYSKSKELMASTPGNALSVYLHGKAAMALGKEKEAKRLLNMATALECENWRSNAIFNSIIKDSALSNDLHFIDFHFGITRSLGKNVLFMDDIYPQALFYQALSKEIIKKIKIIFKLR